MGIYDTSNGSSSSSSSSSSRKNKFLFGTESEVTLTKNHLWQLDYIAKLAACIESSKGITLSILSRFDFDFDKLQIDMDSDRSIEDRGMGPGMGPGIDALDNNNTYNIYNTNHTNTCGTSSINNGINNGVIDVDVSDLDIDIDSLQEVLLLEETAPSALTPRATLLTESVRTLLSIRLLAKNGRWEDIRYVYVYVYA